VPASARDIQEQLCMQALSALLRQLIAVSGWLLLKQSQRPQSCQLLAPPTADATNRNRWPRLLLVNCPSSAPGNTTTAHRCRCPITMVHHHAIAACSHPTHRISRVFCLTPFAS
jgi:hypothetical protein